MSEPRDEHQYEAPAIEDREEIDTPLVATIGSGELSAAFHPTTDGFEYEPPAIAEREAIDKPLVAVVGSVTPV